MHRAHAYKPNSHRKSERTLNIDTVAADGDASLLTLASRTSRSVAAIASVSCGSE